MKKYLFLLFISLAISMPAKATHLSASEDEYLNEITSAFECNSDKNNAACSIINEYKQAALPKEGDFLGRMRAINVGYLKESNGTVKKQLIVFGYQWTRDFHKKIYYPNKACSIYVFATSVEEEELINTAIQALLNNESADHNGAYQYGKSYEWSSKSCKEIALNPSQTSVSSHDGLWRVRFSEDHVYFLSDGWKNSEQLVFKAKL